MIENKDLKFNFKISDEHFFAIEKIEENIWFGSPFFENIKSTLINFKNEEKDFSMDDREGLTIFLNKYYYSINSLLLSLNAYLLEIFLISKKKQLDENWPNIYKKFNKTNTIVNLFIYLLAEKKRDISKEESLVLSQLYVYENLYRHQISHGWIKIFNNIHLTNISLSSNKDTALVISIKELPIKDNKIIDKELLNSMNTVFFDNLREESKKSLKRMPTFGFFYPNSIKGIYLEKIIEPMIEIKIDNSKLFSHEYDSKDIFIELSLNNLIRVILKMVKLIDK